MFNKQLEFKFYDINPEQIPLPLDYSGAEQSLTYSYTLNTPVGTINAYTISDMTYGDNEIKIDGKLVLKQDSGWLKNKVGNWLGINYEK